jgi:hypothetical protein
MFRVKFKFYLIIDNSLDFTFVMIDSFVEICNARMHENFGKS